MAGNNIATIDAPSEPYNEVFNQLLVPLITGEFGEGLRESQIGYGPTM